MPRLKRYQITYIPPQAWYKYVSISNYSDSPVYLLTAPYGKDATLPGELIRNTIPHGHHKHDGAPIHGLTHDNATLLSYWISDQPHSTAPERRAYRIIIWETVITNRRFLPRSQG